MARRRKGRAVHGILLLDKAAGISSNQALQRVRGIYRAQKAGHGGTLDPFAEGLLPILLGEATKFGRFLLDADKSYEVTLAFGSETDTDDLTGEVIREADIPWPNEIDWANILQRFQGKQLQTPPIYSALKIAGQRAYDLARKGELPEMTPREITINSIDLLEHDQNMATLRVSCSKGTYIRALVRDIGRELNSAAHAVRLRRCSVGSLVGNFHDIRDLSLLREQEDYLALDQLLLPLDDCVRTLPKADISDEKLRFFRCGNDVEISTGSPDGEYAFYHQNNLLGVGKIVAGRAYPERLCALKE